MSGLFSWAIIIWSILLCVTMGIGGYFMFRKFLKKLPKSDGMSILDWENHYIEASRHLWTIEMKGFLEELVYPVPELFRDVARNKIAGKIGQLALEQKADSISIDLVIQGYILATPKRDHKFLRTHLQNKQIELAPYEKYFVS